MKAEPIEFAARPASLEFQHKELSEREIPIVGQQVEAEFVGEMETRHFTSSEVVVPSETPESNQKAGKVPNMKISKAGIDFIISYEGGCHLSIYDATNPSNKYQRGRIGDWTIGYGHKLTEEELKSGVYDKGITEEKAKELFADDLVNIEQGKTRWVEAVTLQQFGQGMSLTKWLAPR